MNVSDKVNILIASMNKAEKRGFRQYSTLQGEEKQYMYLFDIFEARPAEGEEVIRELFLNGQKGKSFQSSVRYLYQVLIDFLAVRNMSKSVHAQIFMEMEQAKMLFDRKLTDDAFVVLKKADDLAKTYEDDMMRILAARTELQFHSRTGFKRLTEKELVAKQMNLLRLMKLSGTVNQHNFLFDVMNYRVLHRASEGWEKNDALNDLVLSELNLISGSHYQGFESQKLHLLFQSVYYLESGNYISALRNYRTLISLFERNSHLILNPPQYYLSALVGILDTLLISGMYKDMEQFLQKLRNLDKEEYPSDFRLRIYWLDYYFRMSVILHLGDFDEIGLLQEHYRERLLERYSMLPLDVQIQYFVLQSACFLSVKEIKKARKVLNPIFAQGKIFQEFPLFRVARLLFLIIKTESEEYDGLEKEIKSYKYALKRSPVSETERIVFRYINSFPLPVLKQSRLDLWKTLSKRINPLRLNKQEMKYLKRFDFFSFMESRLTGIPLSPVLRKNNG